MSMNTKPPVLEPSYLEELAMSVKKLLFLLRPMSDEEVERIYSEKKLKEVGEVEQEAEVVQDGE